MVGQSMSHLLKILGLGLGASKTKIKVHYRQLACKYHPDKNDYVATGITMEEATKIFMLNNVYDYLKERTLDGWCPPVQRPLCEAPKTHDCMLSCLRETRNKKQ